MSFQNIGKALAILRRKHGLSQAELAQSCGIGRAQLSRYEAGKELMKLPTLERMLSQLTVEPEEFFRFVRTLDASPPPPHQRRGPSRVDERQLAAAFQNLHAAIDELREVVERSIDPATRFARLIDEAAASSNAIAGITDP
ncbi:MAG TPA: helix-turn-helix transcriptional regulator [Thermoanaerobaculia bacterium]|nr:helix-turn-helix transcriptional regulator [Thermoanaerobaculia bacterium]